MLLAAFAAGAYAFVAHAVAARTNATLADALLDFQSELLAERSPGMKTLGAAREVLSDMRSRTIAFALFDAAGRAVAIAVPPPRRPSPAEDSEPAFDPRRVGPFVSASPASGPMAVTLPDSEGGYRAALAPLVMPDGRFTLVAATSIHDDAEMLAEARSAIVVAIPAALVLAWLGGWLLARRTLAPMVAMRDTTARISARTLGERVPLANPDDEVGQLATVINGLLERLERSFAQQQQFMADASHELRTPVAVVQSETSRALSRPERSPAEYTDALLVVNTAARRLRRIVDDLFLLARADAGELSIRHGPLYLDEVIAESARELRSLADARGVHVAVDAPAEAPYAGDEELLHRLLINLLDNAIKHTPPGGAVTVHLAGTPLEYRVEVMNPGPPIPAELAPRIFDRFVRGDAARSRQPTDTAGAVTSGAGLGLSIARWIAGAHGGTLGLEKSDESGTAFRLRLPRTASRAADAAGGEPFTVGSGTCGHLTLHAQAPTRFLAGTRSYAPRAPTSRRRS
ncbi:MAG: sensor histidine kinase [Gemmatimonadales bacterium]